MKRRLLRGLLCAALLLSLYGPGVAEAQPAAADTTARPLTAPPQATSPAEGTTFLRLDALLAAVRTDNPSLRAARLHADALATRPAQVSALPDPMIGVSYRPFAVTGADGVVPGKVAMQQKIPFPGKRRLAGEAAAYAAEATSHDADELLLDLVYQVKTSYYELFRIQEQERLIAGFQRQLADFEEAAAVKYEVGTGMQQAILKAQLEKNTLARHRLDLAALRRTHLERIARLTNRPDLAGTGDSLFVERPAYGDLADVDLREALATRPALLSVDAGLDKTDAEIARARKDYLPDFVVGAGLMDMMGPGGAAMPLDNLGNRFGVEIGVVVPLQRGKRAAAVREARLRREQLEAQREAIETQIQTETGDLQARLLADGRALDLYRDTLLPQAGTTLEATLSAYTTGRTDFLDLLDAQRMLFDLRMDYEATYSDYATTRARLERILGSSSTPSSDTLSDQRIVPAEDR